MAKIQWEGEHNGWGLFVRPEPRWDEVKCEYGTAWVWSAQRFAGDGSDEIETRSGWATSKRRAIADAHDATYHPCAAPPDTKATEVKP